MQGSDLLKTPSAGDVSTPAIKMRARKAGYNISDAEARAQRQL